MHIPIQIFDAFTLDRIAKEKGMSKSQRKKFGDYIERSKSEVSRGGNANLSDQQLRELADEFLEIGF